MPVVVLTSRPGHLSAELVEAVRNAWGGGDALWLSVGEAAEFEVPTRPDNADAVWRDLQDANVDLNLVAKGNRRKRMLLADMDSTMIQQECIDELAEVAGVGAHVKDITARAMDGALDFEQALRERVALLRGLNTDVIQRVMDERIHFMPGGHILLATMKAQGAYAALVSGGFTAFTERVASALGFDTHRANTLLAKSGQLTGEVGLPILGKEAKVQALEEITAEQGLKHADVLAVGDGANDLGMLSAAGLGVALHAKPSVQAACKLKINHGDLTALLFLQGYAREEFAPN